MYNFRSYNPKVPRMVTSFKGNQKLIFEGYRYNIHHIVPAKNVKTWRCVCAKKLTSARSWCKGRAETWENDSSGTSKGEHNHPAEHDVAELEYFKSQLILAAIEFPEAPLNELIDEATSMMSQGVNFNSRESLKKSLTVARKTAENGGFKMKSYKNSADSTGSRSKNHNTLPTTIPRDDSIYSSMKLFENGTMASLLSLAKHCQEANNNNELEDSKSNPSLDDFQQSTSSTSSLLNHMGVPGDYDEDRPPIKFPKLETSSHTEDPLIVNLFSSALNGNNTLNSSGYASMSGLSNKDWNNSLILDRSSANGMDSSRSTPLSNSGYESGSNKRKNVDKAKRVNDIFNKLSHKAAIAASTGPSTPVTTKTGATTTVSSSNGSTTRTTSSTQTDQELQDGAEIRVSACLGSISDCSCRIIRVCCCSNETCTRGLKRSHP